MKWIFLLFSVFFFAFLHAQSIEGIVSEQEGSQLIGATVILFQNGEVVIGKTTDVDGRFQLKDLPTGEYFLEVSYVGFTTRRIDNIEVGESSNIKLEIILDSQNLLDYPVIITPGYQNDFTETSIQDFHFKNMPGAYEDPSRLMIKTPSVSTSNDQSNAITTKGIPPHFNRWAINDTEIVNPNHLSNAGTFSDRSSPSFGGVNMINANMIQTYQFVFSPITNQFYNSAGYSNITLDRNRREGLGFNLSLLGLQADYTKKIKNGNSLKNNSITASYRYSTVGLLTALGLDLGEEDIQFQDLAIFGRTNIKRNPLQVYFIGGLHSNKHPIFDKENPVFKDLYEINYTGNQWVTGFQYTANNSNYLPRYHIIANASQRFSNNDMNGEFNPFANYQLQENIASLNHGFYLYPWKKQEFFINHTSTFQAYQYSQTELVDPSEIIDTSFFRNYLSVRYLAEISKIVEINAVAGIAILDKVYPIASLNPKVLLSDQVTLEVNASVQTLTIDPLLLYRNKNLTPMNQYSMSGSLQYQNNIHSVSGGAFYQYFNQVPYDEVNNRLSYFDDYQLIASSTSLKTGAQTSIYGVQAQWAMPNNRKTFVLLGGSFYQIQVLDPQNIDRNSSYNFNYTLGSTLTHTFWEKLTIGVSYHWHPGAVDKFRPEPDEIRLPDFHRMDARVVYNFGKDNRLSLSLDIQNVLNRKNISSYYFDVVRNDFLPINQLGMIPILSFRADFRQ